MKNSGFGGDKYYLVKGQPPMATDKISKSDLVAQLNQMQKNGASEDQIAAAIKTAGYDDTAIGVGMDGKFEAVNIGSGKVAGVDYEKPTAAEQKESASYYKSLESPNFESAPVSKQPVNIQTTETVTVSGGGSQTTQRAVEVDTPTSIALKQQADSASKEAGLYSNFAQRPGGTLDKKLANGEISQEKYDEIKSLSPEQRAEKAAALRSESTKLNDQANAAKIEQTPGTTTTTPGATETTTTTTAQTEAAAKVEEVKKTAPDGDTAASQADSNNNNDTPGEGENIAKDSTLEQSGDPYVYNGESTIASEAGNEQQDVNANEDPFEQSRQDAENAYNEGVSGNEQADIDPDEDPFEKARQDAEDAYNNDSQPTDADLEAAAGGGGQAAGTGVAAPVPFASAPDWRFRIKLAPQSDYLYNAPNPGILAPLKGKGIIFPYTPSISVAYSAKYDTTSLTHSNYNLYTYQGSAVENITVTGDFTAQDITEANYMLAVIHFCRSATKMFYGQDKNRGVPPPLLYLSGLGEYQFDNHPVVLTNFTYTLPNDVDYINAYPSGGTTGINGASLTPFQQPGFGRELGAIGGAINSVMRLFGAGLTTRGTPTSAGAAQNTVSSAGVTRVPTKISISLTFNPMITRYAASNKFSLEAYAKGDLLRGSTNPGNGGGMW